VNGVQVSHIRIRHLEDNTHLPHHQGDNKAYHLVDPAIAGVDDSDNEPRWNVGDIPQPEEAAAVYLAFPFQAIWQAQKKALRR